MGVPDNRIVLMLADDMPCNARNAFPGAVYNGKQHPPDLYAGPVEVDYRGDEVTPESFLRVLTGRGVDGLPRSKALRSDRHSNVLIFVSGHGGDEFLKFQDAEEISSHDIAAALREMHLRGRYRELLLMVDTCQAGTLFNAVSAPGVLCVGSSGRGENSYAHTSDAAVGLATLDRFTAATLDFFEGAHRGAGAAAAGIAAPAGGRGASGGMADGAGAGGMAAAVGRGGGGGGMHAATVGALLASYNPALLRSTPSLVNLWDTPLRQVPLSDFFGSATRVELMRETYNFTGEEGQEMRGDEAAAMDAARIEYGDW
ncbi:unnamed protein product [Phaeothamnion confervicola]